MCSVCETRICYCVDGCDRSPSSDSRRSSAPDHSLEFGGHIVHEEAGRHAILRHYDTVPTLARMSDTGFLLYVIHKLTI